jgi:hypothetical protein
MVDDRLMIAARNYADQGAFSWYQGWWLDALPLANLLDRDINHVARTAGADPAGTNFIMDFRTPRMVGLVALINHNMSQTARFRVAVSGDGFRTIIADSGEIAVWPVIEEFGQLPWGQFQWGGVLQATSIQGDFPINSYFVLDQPMMAQQIKVYMIDPNNPDGYVQAGRLYAGPVWQPSVNATYPLEFWYEDDTKISYSRGGVTFVDEGERRRVIRFKLQFIPEAEMMGQVFDQLDRAKGIGGDIIVIPQPTNLGQIYRQAIYGRQRVLNPNSQTFFNQYEREIEIEEFR